MAITLPANGLTAAVGGVVVVVNSGGSNLLVN
jgi:hypothetical protein